MNADAGVTTAPYARWATFKRGSNAALIGRAASRRLSPRETDERDIVKLLIGLMTVTGAMLFLAPPALAGVDSSEPLSLRSTPAISQVIPGTAENRRRLRYLGWGTAKLFARRALRDYFEGKWKYGYQRQVEKVRRLSRTRVRLRYSFNDARYWGYITIFRTRPGWHHWAIHETVCADGDCY